ncbi:AraC family transcriptional regulator [Nitratireductor arenosus]|uniref:helix-turn-helix domain-containing protein n=1 Tax=Nitratireductor arenosus TaxID=2682096 RepID=UPI0031B6434C
MRKYNWELFPHRHSDLFQIAIVHSGTGRVNFDIESRTLRSHTAVILPHGVMHNFELSADASVDLMTIDADYFQFNLKQVVDAGAEASFVHPDILAFDPRAADWAALQSSFGNAETHQNVERSRTRNALLAANLVAIISILSDQLSHAHVPEEKAGHVGLYLRFREALEASYGSRQSIADYAARLFVTEQSLYRACKAVSGVSPSKLVQQRLVLEGQRLLLYSDMTVSEIAYALGFTEPSTFSRFFTERTGQSPVKFRAKRLG